MDTYGYIILGIAVVLYFVARKNNPKLKSFAYWLIGIGMGLLAGIYGSYAVVMSALH